MHHQPATTGRTKRLLGLVVVLAIATAGAVSVPMQFASASRAPVELYVTADQPRASALKDMTPRYQKCAAKYHFDAGRNTTLLTIFLENNLKQPPVLPKGSTFQIRVSNRSGVKLPWLIRDWEYERAPRDKVEVCQRFVADAYGWITLQKANASGAIESVGGLVDAKYLSKSVVEVREIIPNGPRGPVRAVGLPATHKGSTSALECAGLWVSGFGKVILKGFLNILSSVLSDLASKFPELKAASAVAAIVSTSVNYLDERVNGSVTTTARLKYKYKATVEGFKAYRALKEAARLGQLKILVDDPTLVKAIEWKPLSAGTVLDLKTWKSILSEAAGVYDTVHAICG